MVCLRDKRFLVYCRGEVSWTMVDLYLGDCLDILPKLSLKSKVDCVIADIPYGTTACKWDTVIPFESMWKCLNEIVKDDNTPILLFAQQPFTSELIHSNLKNFKYVWYYNKLIASNFASAKYQPMKHIEEICVFTRNGKTPRYFPVMQPRAESGKIGYLQDTTTILQLPMKLWVICLAMLQRESTIQN